MTFSAGDEWADIVLSSRKVDWPLARFCDWNGRTDYDVINTPIPPLKPRVEALEEKVEVLWRERNGD